MSFESFPKSEQPQEEKESKPNPEEKWESPDVVHAPKGLTQEQQAEWVAKQLEITKEEAAEKVPGFKDFSREPKEKPAETQSKKELEDIADREAQLIQLIEQSEREDKPNQAKLAREELAKQRAKKSALEEREIEQGGAPEEQKTVEVIDEKIKSVREVLERAQREGLINEERASRERLGQLWEERQKIAGKSEKTLLDVLDEGKERRN